MFGLPPAVKYGALLLACASSFGAGWSWASSRAEARANALALAQTAKIVDSITRDNTAHNTQNDQDTKDFLAVSEQLADLRASNAALLAASREVVRVEVPTGCEAVRIKPAVRVCINAALTGDAAEAAACAAYGVHAEDPRQPVPTP